MLKLLWKFTLIILLNLFAFLSIWHILDVIFSGNWYFKLIFIFISIVNLVFIALIYLRNQINNNIEKNDGKWSK